LVELRASLKALISLSSTSPISGKRFAPNSIDVKNTITTRPCSSNI